MGRGRRRLINRVIANNLRLTNEGYTLVKGKLNFEAFNGATKAVMLYG
jgi:hypothetical protein